MHKEVGKVDLLGASGYTNCGKKEKEWYVGMRSLDVVCI